MTSFQNIQAQLFSTIIFLLCTVSSQASDLSLRFSQAHVDNNKNELYVNVKVKYSEKGNLVLAGQNYRFYYDSEVLDLKEDESTSKLSGDVYGDLIFESHIKGIDAAKVRNLKFDDNLGFANFSIDLTDSEKGGLKIKEKDGWVAVATLKFEIKEEQRAYDIVWGREDLTGAYATAFVEMAEWEGANKLGTINIINYGDLTSTPSLETPIVVADVQVGPNPTSDFINITFDSELVSSARVVLRNAAGTQVKSEVLSQGTIETNVDLSDLNPSSYFVEIVCPTEGLIHTGQVVLAK